MVRVFDVHVHEGGMEVMEGEDMVRVVEELAQKGEGGNGVADKVDLVEHNATKRSRSPIDALFGR